MTASGCLADLLKKTVWILAIRLPDISFGTLLAVGWMVARKNRMIDMVEALKGAE